ncbi:hypothetical protein KCU81_g6396, partial [Aureobasidium melanogenum]
MPLDQTAERCAWTAQSVKLASIFRYNDQANWWLVPVFAVLARGVKHWRLEKRLETNAAAEHLQRTTRPLGFECGQPLFDLADHEPWAGGEPQAAAEEGRRRGFKTWIANTFGRLLAQDVSTHRPLADVVTGQRRKNAVGSQERQRVNVICDDV